MTDSPFPSVSSSAPDPSPTPAASATISRRRVPVGDEMTLSVVVASPAAGISARDGVPPVLALHGFASSAVNGWGRTGHFDALTRAGRIVIAPDLPAHGDSDKPHDEEHYSLDRVLAVVVDAARAVAAELAASGTLLAAGFDLLGYSLGARLGWTIAGRVLLPVRRMVLGGFDGRPLFEGVDTARLEQLAAGVPGNDVVALAALVSALAGTGGAGRGSVAGGEETSGGGAPSVPTLIVAGDRDPLAARADAFAVRLGQGSFLAVPRRNHISTVPAGIFRRGVVDFLG